MSKQSLAWILVAAVVAAGLSTIPVNTQKAASGDDLDARARAIHSRVLVLDAHTDVLLESTPPQYFAPGHTSRTGIDPLVRGGVGAVAFAIAVGSGPRTADGVAAARAEADQKLAAIKTFLEAHSDRTALARSASDIERIHASGKVAIIVSFLNARSLGTDVTAIDGFYREGVRLFGLTHAGHNDFADSSRPGDGPVSQHGGLSALGKEAIARLNRLGVIVDVSQLTTAGVQQVLATTKAPVIASHSNVRALVDNTRNLSDVELGAIKVNGGVVHVTPFNAYLRPATADGTPAPRATVADLVNHIDYIVKRIGVDHVGIGTDFNHGSGIDGFDSEADAPNVTRELVRRGYTEADIRKIWGGNFLRVFREVEAAAKQSSKSE